MSQDFVDDRQLAQRTPISRVTWQNWRVRGQGPPFYKIGKRCLYKWADVETWIETQKTQPKA